MAEVDVDVVPGTGSARRRLLRVGVRLALTAGFLAVGWLLCGLAASAASAAELPQSPSSITSPTNNDNGGLLGNTVGSIGNTVDTTVDNTVDTTVNSVLDTVHTTLTTVGNTVNSTVGSVSTGVVQPTVTTVTKTVSPVITPLVSAQPATAQPDTTQTPAATNPLPAQPSPAPAAAPLVTSAHHSVPKAAPTNATRSAEQLRPDAPPVRLPKTPQPAPQQPLAPAPTISTGHGPNSGNKHAVPAVISAIGDSAALAQLTTVASHSVVVPGEMPGLPSVSPD